MNDNIWKRDEIESPCVKLCVIHVEHRICIGCFRTISEISNWSTFTTEKRKHIVAKLAKRGMLLKPQRRGGRAKN